MGKPFDSETILMIKNLPKKKVLSKDISLLVNDHLRETIKSKEELTICDKCEMIKIATKWYALSQYQCASISNYSKLKYLTCPYHDNAA